LGTCWYIRRVGLGTRWYIRRVGLGTRWYIRRVGLGTRWYIRFYPPPGDPRDTPDPALVARRHRHSPWPLLSVDDALSVILENANITEVGAHSHLHLSHGSYHHYGGPARLNKRFFHQLLMFIFAHRVIEQFLCAQSLG